MFLILGMILGRIENMADDKKGHEKIMADE